MEEEGESWYKFRKNLLKKSKKEIFEVLSKENKALRYGYNCQVSNRINKHAQLVHFRRKLLKIRNEIDYMLKHPYSRDSGFTTRTDKRDIPQNQPRGSGTATIK